MAAGRPIRIGLFVGREWSWPPAFLDEVNRRTPETGVTAEYVKIGGTTMNEPVPYRVIVEPVFRTKSPITASISKMPRFRALRSSTTPLCGLRMTSSSARHS